MIICPVCKKNLILENKTYRCTNNHSFDKAKQGYANLLLSNQKHSKMPGDDKDMVISRKNFLEKDYYKKISDEVNKIVLSLNENKDKINILDIGCGEGYYTKNLEKFLNENQKQNEIIGIDISKPAVLEASRFNKTIIWLVASAINLPIENESLDTIICMFAKIIPEEKIRTLKKGGYVVIVSTGKNHLLELKEVVYDKVRLDYYSPIEDMNIFEHVKTINVLDKVKIKENESIKNLFDMTPYRWRSPKIGIERLYALNELDITIDVNIDIFRKK